MRCSCQSPAEHAEHLRQERSVYDRMFPEPIRHCVVDENGNELEISADELMEMIVLKRSGVTGKDLLAWLEKRRAVEK